MPSIHPDFYWNRSPIFTGTEVRFTVHALYSSLLSLDTSLILSAGFIYIKAYFGVHRITAFTYVKASFTVHRNASFT